MNNNHTVLVVIVTIKLLQIVHGALCARNILVSNSMEVKVFNIGTHNLYTEESPESLIKWMSPENIASEVRTSYGDM